MRRFVLAVLLSATVLLISAATQQTTPGPTPRLRGVWWDYSQGPIDPKTGTRGLWLYLTTAEMWPRLTEHLGAAFSQWGYSFGPGLATATVPGLPVQVNIDTGYIVSRYTTADFQPPALGSDCPSSASVWTGDAGFYYAIPNASRTGFVWAKVESKPAPLQMEIVGGLSNGTVGVAYSQSLMVAGGTPPYTWTLAAGSVLPPGLTLSSDGILSGTPTAVGKFDLAVTVTDSLLVARTMHFVSATSQIGFKYTPTLGSDCGGGGVWFEKGGMFLCSKIGSEYPMLALVPMQDQL